jgi:hypothetical protein
LILLHPGEDNIRTKDMDPGILAQGLRIVIAIQAWGMCVIPAHRTNRHPGVILAGVHEELN